MRVLVVDDALTDRMRWGLLGRRHGFVVETAASAIEAVRRLQHSRPDVVLMDLDMPGTDGVATARILRDDPDLQTLTVVCHTGGLRAMDAMATGLFDAELPKDLDNEALVGRLHSLAGPQAVRPLTA